MRRLALLVVLVGGATLLWLLMRHRPERPEPLRLVTWENVLAAQADGELVRTTAALDAGTPRGQAQTVEVDRRDGERANGVLSRPDGDPPYAWLVGEHPSFSLDVLQPMDRELLVELANGTDGPQAVDVLFNGTAVVHQDLPGPDSVFSVTALVPAALQRRGSNRVELHFARTQSRSLQHERALPLAAVLRHVAFAPLGRTREAPPPVPPAGLVAPTAAGAHLVLVLPPDTAARAPLRLPAAPRVVLRFTLQELHSPLEVSLQLDGGRVPLRVFQPGTPVPTTTDFDLTPWAGQVVVLEFWAREARDAGAAGARLGDANVLVPADWTDPRRAAPPPPAPPVVSRPSFLVVVLDAFARRYQSAVVNGSLVTQAMDALADHALVFAEATTPASYTLASIGSLLTGQFPLTHGVLATERAGAVTRLAPDAPRLAAELHERGWRTAAWITNPNAAAEHGYDAGFEHYDELFRDPALWSPTGGVPGDVLPSRLAEFLQQVAGQPFLAYVHVFEPHAPYESPPDLHARFVRDASPGAPDGSRAWIDAFKAGEVTTDEAGWTHLRELYAARAALSDRVLARLLVALVKAGRDADTVVVVLGDHGESLGERGLVEHGDAVPREQIDVPLLISVPGLGKGRRSGPASVADVAPTLLRLAGLTPPATMDGIDLLAGPLDADRPLPANSSVYLPELSWTRDGQRLVVDLLTRRVRLYDDVLDPGETHDLSDEKPATRLLLLRELCRAVCDAELARAARPDGAGGAPLDPAQAAQLKSIGYTGAAPADSSPLRLTAELRRLLYRL